MDTRSVLHVRPETDAAGIPEFHPLPYPDDNSEEPPQSADYPALLSFLRCSSQSVSLTTDS